MARTSGPVPVSRVLKATSPDALIAGPPGPIPGLKPPNSAPPRPGPRRRLSQSGRTLPERQSVMEPAELPAAQIDYAIITSQFLSHFCCWIQTTCRNCQQIHCQNRGSLQIEQLQWSQRFLVVFLIHRLRISVIYYLVIK